MLVDIVALYLSCATATPECREAKKSEETELTSTFGRGDRVFVDA